MTRKAHGACPEMSDLQSKIDLAFGTAERQGITLCTAESCSAGALATAFAKAKKADKVFVGGVVAYTKAAKARLLGVSPVLIKERTAVCAPVAEEMAIGAATRSGARLGVSITGVAGPTEDEDGNPVGLIFCAVASADGKKCCRQLTLASKDPKENVHSACIAAVELLLEYMAQGAAGNAP